MSDEIISKGASAGQKVKAVGLVEVTPTIIDTALPKNSGHCMVSDAVAAAAVKKKMRIGKVLTDLQTIRFTDLDTKRRYICFTPRAAQVALLGFDQGVKPEPFSFRLTPVQIIEPADRAVPKTASAAGKGPRKPRLAIKVRPPTHGGGYSKPIKFGGTALAQSAIGVRREFGLRQMGVYSPPVPETVTEPA